MFRKSFRVIDRHAQTRGMSQKQRHWKRKKDVSLRDLYDDSYKFDMIDNVPEDYGIQQYCMRHRTRSIEKKLEFRENSIFDQLYGRQDEENRESNPIVPELEFPGPIHVLEDAKYEMQYLKPFMELQHKIVGVDTESLPNRRKRTISLIQICLVDQSPCTLTTTTDSNSTPLFQYGSIPSVYPNPFSYSRTHVLLYRLSENLYELSSGLHDLLTNPTIRKVGHGIIDDYKILSDNRLIERRFAEDFEERYNLCDTMHMAKELGCLRPNLRNLCQILLRKNLNKSSQNSEWGSINLMKKQIMYAATDAWAPLEIYKIISPYYENGLPE